MTVTQLSHLLSFSLSSETKLALFVSSPLFLINPQWVVKQTGKKQVPVIHLD